MSKRREIDAITVRERGRDPVIAHEYRGWMIEVYRVGRRHEYQTVAEDLTGAHPLYQGPRRGGPGAMTLSRFEVQCWVDTTIARTAGLLPKSR